MKYMQEHGMEVTMISGEGDEWETVIANEQCNYVVVPMTRQITPFKDFVALIRLTWLLRKIKPDIVHTHTPKAGLLGMMAARFAGVKIRIHTVAGLRFMTSTGMTRKLLVAMEKLAYRFANHVWPNSNSLLRYIKDSKLASEKKLEVIGHGSSNGINLLRYSPATLMDEKLKRIKEAILYDDKLFYFLAVGRVVKDKGIVEVVAAFEEVYKQNQSARLLLVGGFEDALDPIPAETKSVIENHPGIIMTGWSNEVEYYMSLANVLVHASYREGFPNVLLQAGAMSCPIICSRIDGNIDVVEHGVSGLIFEVKNTNQLITQMLQALADYSKMKILADKLNARVKDYYAQPIVHSLILKRYRELLSQTGS